MVKGKEKTICQLLDSTENADFEMIYKIRMALQKLSYAKRLKQLQT